MTSPYLVTWQPTSALAWPPRPRHLWWLARYAGAVYPYGLDISKAVDLTLDVIASATVSVSPSGAGEMRPTNLTVSGFQLWFTPTGGQPTRIYTVKFVVTMADGLIYPFEVQQATLPDLDTDIPQIVRSPGFGTPIIWPVSGNLTDDNSNPITNDLGGSINTA